MNYKSLEEYAIQWRLKASRIHHSILEEELVQSFIRSLDGIYFQKLFFLGRHSFESLVSIGKMFEYDIQTGRIIDIFVIPATFQIRLSPFEQKREDSSPFIPQKRGYMNNEESHAIFGSLNVQLEPYDSKNS